jgi:hypothetical protein
MWIAPQCGLFDDVVPSVSWPRAGACVQGTAHERVPLVPLAFVWSRWQWPTPLESDAHSSGNRNTAGSRAHLGVSLSDAVRGGDSNTPRELTAGECVAPPFVEWLMGYPPGWTEIEVSADVSCT